MSTRVFGVAVIGTALAIGAAIAQVRGNTPPQAQASQAASGITAVAGIKVGQYTMDSKAAV